MSLFRKLQNFTLYIFAFSLSFEYWNVFGIKDFSIGAMTGYLYALSVILYPKFNFDFRKSKKFLIPLVLFFFILTFSSALNYTYDSSISWFNMSIFQCLVLFLLISWHLSDRGFEVANKVILFYVLGTLLLTVLYGFGVGVSYSIDMRLSVFGAFANGLGINLAITFLIIISFVFENRPSYGKKRYLLLILLPLILKAIAETGSRGAFFTLVVGLLFFILFIKMKRSYKSLFFAIGLISVFSIFQYMLKTEVFRDRIILAFEEKDTGGRSEIWESVIPLIFKNPVFGIGETGYSLFSKNMFGIVMSPHNVFVEVLIYTGVVGFICYLLLLYQIYKKSLNSYRYSSYLLPGVLFIMILTLFLNGQGLFIKLVWLIFAYIIGVSQNNRTERYKRI